MHRFLKYHRSLNDQRRLHLQDTAFFSSTWITKPQLFVQFIVKFIVDFLVLCFLIFIDEHWRRREKNRMRKRNPNTSNSSWIDPTLGDITASRGICTETDTRELIFVRERKICLFFWEWIFRRMHKSRHIKRLIHFWLCKNFGPFFSQKSFHFFYFLWFGCCSQCPIKLLMTLEEFRFCLTQLFMLMNDVDLRLCPSYQLFKKNVKLNWKMLELQFQTP